MTVPQGPGVRWDAGIVEGDTIAGAFDSMIAKLIVTGRTRQEALERSRRALSELVIEGMPTVTPFHLKVVADPAFAPADAATPFSVHTRWIETDFVNDIPAYSGPVGEADENGERQTIVVEVGGKRVDVTVPAGLSFGGGGGAAVKAAPKRRSSSKAGAAASGDSLTAPMQGTIVKVAVQDGAVVLEAMKMEQPITAHKAGVVSGLNAAPGETVSNGAVLCEIKDA